MYSAADIKWVKNIKRENGTGWAYMEESDLPEFELHFSKHKKASASTAKAGEIIVLFQRVDKMDNVEPKTYITHLVSPIDDVINDSGRENFPVSRRVKVIARGEKERSPTISPEELSFFKPNRGAVHDIRQLNESKPVQQIQQLLWSLFKGYFIQEATVSASDQNTEDIDFQPKIILNNFKVFRERTEINIAPITVITGQNSIGKSSIMKGMMLLADFLDQGNKNQTILSLLGPHSKKHRLNKWENVKSWFTNDKTVSIEYTQQRFTYAFSFIADNNDSEAFLTYFSISHPLRKDKLELSLLSAWIYELKVSSGFIEFYNDPMKRIISSGRINKLVSYEKEISQIRKKKASASKNELVELINQEQGLERNIELIKEQIKAARDSSDFGVLYKQQFDLRESETFDFTLGGIIGEMISDYSLSDIEVDIEENQKDANELHEEIFKMKSEKKLSRSRKTFLNMFKGHNGLSVQHLSPIRARQARLHYRFDENDEFQKLLDWYSSTVLEGEDLGFFERWMNNLGIGKKLFVQDVEGEANTVKVQIDNKPELIDLADLGYGIGQALSILLAILKNRDNKHSYLLIEEPEANLHPKLQSVLAELFYEASVRYKTKFIIETHSEYLIRKWQVLVAKDEMPKEEVLIYYLEEKEAGNIIPRKISITSNGKLSDEFGKGFFDEATRNAMELFQYRDKK